MRGTQAILAIDEGANERHQLCALDLDAAAGSTVAGLDRLCALTSDPRFGHHSAGVSPDGRLVSVLRPGDRPLDIDLLLVDVGSGEAIVPLPHPGDAAIVHHDLARGVTRTVPGTGEGFDARGRHERDGGTVVVIEDRDGADLMQTIDPATGHRPPATGHRPPASGGRRSRSPEPGVTSFFFLAPPVLSVDGSVLLYSLTTPRRAGDVYSSELSTGVTRRLSHSPAGARPAGVWSAPSSGR